MSPMHGQFVWYDLMTADTRSALAFYGAVFNWGATADPGSDYMVLSVEDVQFGGLMALMEPMREAGARPHWMGYIGVDDVDGAVERLQAAGGNVHRAAGDIPDVGRFAVVSDPQGATFTMFAAKSGVVPPPAVGCVSGRVDWHELYTADPEAAFAFYATQFGWTKSGEHDMGAMGLYRMFATPAGPGGGIMLKPSDFPAPAWLFYVNVSSIDAAMTRVREAGGAIVDGPTEVPGGSWVASCLDPQGAMFAMVAAGR